MMNENTLVRLSALLEAYGWDSNAQRKKVEKARAAGQPAVTPSTSCGEIAAMTLQYLRNLVVHKDHGLFKRITRSPWWEAFRAFSKDHPDVEVAEGEPICLAGEAVLQPLVNGLIKWAEENGQL